ncbi:hypothetical protein [Anabaena sp. CCY 0017]|uniref:hypothetical protein n=1 Tax=Anabaena sp. CCY 0017 TaxID=3103866 RepID=UPI0039C6334A
MNNKNIQKFNQEIQTSQKSVELQTLTLEQLNGISGGGKLPSGIKVRIPITVKHNL